MAESSSRLIYQVAVGETQPFWDLCIDSVRRYAKRVQALHVVQTEPILRIAPKHSERSDEALRLGYLPIYEKENAFAYLGRFDSVLVLDADVYVRASAPDIFRSLEAPFCGVYERDLPLTDQHRTKLRKHSRGQFGELDDVGWNWNEDGAEFYNMGVMGLTRGLLQYLRGMTPRQFLEQPRFQPFVDGHGHWRWSTDQTLLNWWLRKDRIPHRSLDWRWNALFGACIDVRPAYFLHFFLASKLPRQGREIPEIINRLEGRP